MTESDPRFTGISTKRPRGRPRARIAVQCELCPTIFETIPARLARGAGRYCSQECRNRAISLKRRAKEDPDIPLKPTVEMSCDSCGGTFMVFPYRGPGTARPARFCSKECRLTRPAFRLVQRKRR